MADLATARKTLFAAATKRGLTVSAAAAAKKRPAAAFGAVN